MRTGAQDPMHRIVLMDSHHFTKLENLIFNLNSKIWEHLHTISVQHVAHKIVLQWKVRLMNWHISLVQTLLTTA